MAKQDETKFLLLLESALKPMEDKITSIEDILNAVKINKLTVPEVVASDCSDAVLDCTYSSADDDVTVQWLHNGSPVYEWRPGVEPRATGVLEGRLDLTYRLASAAGDRPERRALRIVELGPELSGDYTCVVRSQGREARGTQHMTVFSPERDFELTFNTSRDSDVIDVKCVAKRMHPRPDLIIEYNNVPVAQQQQRSWREGRYFEAESTAKLRLRPPARAALACRLRLPTFDYTAITKKYLYLGNQASGSRVASYFSSYIIASVLLSACNINV